MLVAGADPSTLQNLGSIGEFATAVIAAVAAVIAFSQVRSGRSTAKEARVFAYVARLQDPDLIPLTIEARKFWQTGEEGSGNRTRASGMGSHGWRGAPSGHLPAERA